MNSPARIEAHEGGSMTFSGRAAVDVYAATVIASGLDLYRKTGMRPNRAYTPKAMMARAADITGKKFKARDYEAAATALREWAKAQASVVNVVSAAVDSLPCEECARSFGPHYSGPCQH